MAPLDLATTAAGFLREYERELTAGASLAVALAVAVALDRVLAGRGRGLAAAIERGELTPVAQTRLRFLRRLAFAAVILIGALIALAQFGTLSRLAAGLLASGALAAVVVGFAARQVLGNAMAGVMLAITQPLRIGDQVTFEGESGEVEDVRLNYTYLRTATGSRVVIPNEQLATGILHNHTVLGAAVPVEVDVWLPTHADAELATRVLGEVEDVDAVSVAEISTDGIRLSATGRAVPAESLPARQSQLRTACLRRLREGGLLAPAEPAPPA